MTRIDSDESHFNVSFIVTDKVTRLWWWCRASCPRMSVDILGTNCDQCRSMVQCCFTSTEAIRLIRAESPGRPPRLSHSSWTLTRLSTNYNLYEEKGEPKRNRAETLLLTNLTPQLPLGQTGWQALLPTRTCDTSRTAVKRRGCG